MIRNRTGGLMLALLATSPLRPLRVAGWAYIELMRTLLEHGVYPAIATHDERIIEETKRFAADQRISRVRALRQAQPRWELSDNRNQLLFLAANLAIEPFPSPQIRGGQGRVPWS